jgi:hypothetical protein
MIFLAVEYFSWIANPPNMISQTIIRDFIIIDISFLVNIGKHLKRN